MKETHPFGSFVPRRATFLILGSFTGRQAVQDGAGTDSAYDWFYGTRRNQFWPILEAVYGLNLKDKASKQEALESLGIAIADLIYQCERKQGNNLDNNLYNIVYNTEEIVRILESYPIQTILFSSRFVEKRFSKIFRDYLKNRPDLTFITLPSPSPRYAQMTLAQKIKRYRELLPSLKRAPRRAAKAGN